VSSKTKQPTNSGGITRKDDVCHLKLNGTQDTTIDPRYEAMIGL
jgi:hypothetical protein